ncbi:hypothetical protein [Mycobacterium uberis]|uniref:hypothetical protein n=1 Tax=Mycobacterium uberis TaxID=2162698 RepID=UPI001FB3A83F|nr:hypothetical protein [Mycobacterium uberis]
MLVLKTSKRAKSVAEQGLLALRCLPALVAGVPLHANTPLLDLPIALGYAKKVMIAAGALFDEVAHHGDIHATHPPRGLSNSTRVPCARGP